VGNLIANFVLPRPVGFGVMPYVRDRQADGKDRHTKVTFNASSPMEAGGIIWHAYSTNKCC